MIFIIAGSISSMCYTLEIPVETVIVAHILQGMEATVLDTAQLHSSRRDMF